MKTTLTIQNAMLSVGKTIFFEVTWLNQGSNRTTMTEATTKANTTTNSDSPKNCLMICQRLDPTALRIPTSLPLFSERAVLRFMKLIQASSNTKMPTIPNNHTY